jgi:hypothetical protein
MEALHADMERTMDRLRSEHDAEVRRLKDLIKRLQGVEAEE